MKPLRCCPHSRQGEIPGDGFFLVDCRTFLFLLEWVFFLGYSKIMIMARGNMDSRRGLQVICLFQKMIVLLLPSKVEIVSGYLWTLEKKNISQREPVKATVWSEQPSS